MDISPFIAAVCASPDDDAPRLIYADYLDEHGESERAEFIGVQVAMEPLRHPAGGLVADMAMPGGKRIRRRLAKEREEKWTALSRRERELLGPSSERIDGRIYFARAVAWFLDDAPLWLAFRPEWRRGFVAAVTCTAADWLAHEAALYWRPAQGRPCPATAQPIEEVRLTTRPLMVRRPAMDAAMDAVMDGNHFRLAGRDRQARYGYPIPHADEILLSLLHAEWPGVRFVLPSPRYPAAGDTFIPVATGQVVGVLPRG